MSKKINLAISAVITLGLSCQATAGDENMNMGNVKGMEKCYGVAKAGMNDCGTAKHNCAGEAKLDGSKEDYVLMPTGLCQKIVSGAQTSKDRAEAKPDATAEKVASAVKQIRFPNK